MASSFFLCLLCSCLTIDFGFVGTEVCSNSTFQMVAQYLVNTVCGVLPDGGGSSLCLGRRSTWSTSPGASRRRSADAPAPSASTGAGLRSSTSVRATCASRCFLTLCTGYEVSDACTSIVAQTTDGKICARDNMDFWEGMGFTNSLREALAQVRHTPSPWWMCLILGYY